ncbi:MAG: serine/threonine-protein kinase, partial [Nannocystaceae bacterium]
MDDQTTQDSHVRPGADVERFEGNVTASLLGRYIVLDRLGQGGMGVVYAAFDPELERKVALKIVRPDRVDPELQRSMIAEARAMARLDHPNVVGVFEVGEFDEQVYVAMEYVKGQTLRTWLETDRPWRDRLAALLQAGRGLAAAHRDGIVHRDFKPGNVLVGESGRVRVSDFGLARRQENHETKSHRSLGARLGPTSCAPPGSTHSRA